MDPADDGPEMPEGRGYQMRGAGVTVVPIARAALWDLIRDHRRLARSIPGAEIVRELPGTDVPTYEADVPIGVGRLRGTYTVTVAFEEMMEPDAVVLVGGAAGPFGKSRGEGWVNFVEHEEGTAVHYTYAVLIQGMVALAGGRLLDGAANALIDKFFKKLAQAARTSEAPSSA